MHPHSDKNISRHSLVSIISCRNRVKLVVYQHSMATVVKWHPPQPSLDIKSVRLKISKHPRITFPTVKLQSDYLIIIFDETGRLSTVWCHPCKAAAEAQVAPLFTMGDCSSIPQKQSKNTIKDSKHSRASIDLSAVSTKRGCGQSLEVKLASVGTRANQAFVFESTSEFKWWHKRASAQRPDEAARIKAKRALSLSPNQVTKLFERNLSQNASASNCAASSSCIELETETKRFNTVAFCINKYGSNAACLVKYLIGRIRVNKHLVSVLFRNYHWFVFMFAVPFFLPCRESFCCCLATALN